MPRLGKFHLTLASQSKEARQGTVCQCRGSAELRASPQFSWPRLRRRYNKSRHAPTTWQMRDTNFHRNHINVSRLRLARHFRVARRYRFRLVCAHAGTRAHCPSSAHSAQLAGSVGCWQYQSFGVPLGTDGFVPDPVVQTSLCLIFANGSSWERH